MLTKRRIILQVFAIQDNNLFNLFSDHYTITVTFLDFRQYLS